MASGNSKRWPAIPVADWQATRDTLHLYTQVVGKIRLASEPHTNHWWNVPLYVTSRGLTTSLMPHPTREGYGALSGAVFVDGALDAKTKELIALAVAVSKQCDGATMPTRSRS